MRLLLPLLVVASCSDYDLVPGPVDVDPGTITDCGFTRVGTTAYYRYDCNPVFTTTDEAWAPDIGGTAFAVTEVLGHPFYQLWYIGYATSDSYALGYAVSPEGTDWTPQPDNPGLSSDDAQDFDKTVMQAPQAEYDPVTEQYILLYGGLDLSTRQTNGGIGIATSLDGENWERKGDNPVIPLSPTNVQGSTGWCWPLDLNVADGGGFTGWIAGANNAGACEAWTMEASDLDHWTVHPNKAFAAGQSGKWDDQGLIALNVATLHGTSHLWYVGFGDWDQQGSVRVAKNAFLGEATQQADGSWQRGSTPVPINMTDDGNVSAVAAVTVGDRVALWVTDVYGDASAVGYFLYDPDKAAEEDAAAGGGS